MASRNPSPGCAGWALIVLVVAFIMTTAAILEGCVLSTLWRWYVHPVTNWPNLSIAMAIGIGITVSVVQNAPDYNATSDHPVRDLAMKLYLRPILAIIVGWIVFQFV